MGKNQYRTSKMTPVSRDTSSAFADGVDELVRGWKRPSAIWSERKHIHQISVPGVGQQKLKGKQHLGLISENIFFSFSVEPQTETLEAWKAQTDEWVDRSPVIQDTRAPLINNEEQRRKSHSKFNTLLDSPDCWETAAGQIHSTCCGGS